MNNRSVAVSGGRKNLNLASLDSKTDCAAVAAMAFALFGFLGNVMIDYQWGTNLVVNSFAIFYWMTLRWMIPFPPNYWGAGAVFYFALFLLSFAVLNRKEPTVKNLLEMIRVASLILILFEIGVYFSVPGFMNKWVIGALYYTPLSGLTNWDLLGASISLFAISQTSFLIRNRPSKRDGRDEK